MQWVLWSTGSILGSQHNSPGKHPQPPGGHYYWAITALVRLMRFMLNAHCIYMGLPRSWWEKFAPTVLFGVKHLYDRLCFLLLFPPSLTVSLIRRVHAFKYQFMPMHLKLKHRFLCWYLIHLKEFNSKEPFLWRICYNQYKSESLRNKTISFMPAVMVPTYW